MVRQVEPGGRSALDAVDFVVVDTETTGLGWSERLVEVAAVRFRGEDCLRSFQSVVHPRREIPPEAVRVHGITDAMVARAPPAAEVLPALARFCEGAVLLAHHASFDEAILATEFVRAGVPAPEEPLYCTLALARAVFPEAPRHSLAALAGRLGLAHAEAHRALSDAQAARAVFRACVARLGPGAGLEELSARAGPARSLRGGTVALVDLPWRLRGLVPGRGAGRGVELLYRADDGARAWRRGVVEAVYARGAEACVDLRAPGGTAVTSVALGRVLAVRRV